MKRLIAGIVFGIVGISAQAASLDLRYTGSNQLIEPGVITASVGDVLTFEIDLDFTDDPVLGGGFDIAFTESRLDFLSYEIFDFGDPMLGRAPDVGNGLLSNAAVGSFTGISLGVVAEVSFLVTSVGGFNISLQAASGVAGPWVSFTDLVSLVEPEYGSVQAFVPVPAAAWLFLSGLLVLTRFRSGEPGVALV